MPASVASASRTLTFDSQLIEDFLHTADVLIDTTAERPMATFLNRDGQTEALVICQLGQASDGLYHVCREPLSDSGWNIFGLGAQAYAIAAVDSNLAWAIGTDRQIWRVEAGRWNLAPQLPSRALLPALTFPNLYLPLSVGIDGAVWAIDSNGNLYQFNAAGNDGVGAWQAAPGAPPLTAAPVGAAGSLWGLSAGGIVRQTTTTWEAVSWPGISPVQLGAGSDGSVWGLDQSGQVYQFVSGQWQPETGTTNLFMLAPGTTSNVWGIQFGNPKFQLVQYGGTGWMLNDQGPAFTGLIVPCVLPQVSIAPNGAVWCLDSYGVVWKKLPQPNALWRRQMMPTGMAPYFETTGVSEVVVGRTSTGAPQGFWIASENVFAVQLNSAGVWCRADSIFTQAGTGLGVTNRQDTQDLFVYGVTNDGNMFIIPYTGDSIDDQVVTDSHGTLAGALLQVSALSDSAVFTAAVWDGRLWVQWGSLANPLGEGSGPALLMEVTQSNSNVPVPTNLTRLVRVPWVESGIGFYCGALGSDGIVYAVFGISPNVTSGAMASFVPLMGSQSSIASPISGISSTSTLRDAGGYVRIYATDTNNRLWVIRQTGTTGDSNNPWTWSAWHPLGNNCKFLADGPGSLRTRDLLVVNGDSLLTHLWQDATSLNWNTAMIRQPNGVAEQPYYVALYTTEITVYDANGNPEPNVPVTVTAVESAPVWVNGVQYDVGTGTAPPFMTGSLGKLTLTSLALGLHTPQLTFTAEGLASAVVVYPPQNVQNRLATVDGPTLQGAQSRTSSVPTPQYSSLVATSQEQGNCSDAATVMNDAMQFRLLNLITPDQVTGIGLGGIQMSYDDVRAQWRAKLVEGRRPRRHRHHRRQHQNERVGDWDSFWADLEAWGEDVWHGIEHGVLGLESVFLDMANGVIELGVVLVDVGEYTINYFIKTFDDVVHAVVSAFRWLGAKVEDALNWLKEFFSWDDILNTKTVIEYYVNSAMSNLVVDCQPGTPNNVQQIVQAQFQALINLITGEDNSGNDAFSQVQSTYGGSSFNDAVSNCAVNPNVGSSALNPDAAHKTYHAHQVKSNYARTKSETYIGQGGRVVPSGGGAALLAAGGSFADLLALIDSSLCAPTAPFSKDQGAYQSGLQNIQHPKDLFSTAISDFLALMKQIAIDAVNAADEIVLALLDLASECLSALQDVLNHVIRIPVLSWLYEVITGHPLTLLDALCLVLAIPGTLLYKLIWGGGTTPPFTSGDVVTITGQAIPWPPFLPSAMLPLNNPALSREQASTLAEVLGMLSFIVSLPYTWIDVGTDIDSMAQRDEEGLPSFLSAASVIISLISFGLGSPYTVFQKPAPWSKADALYVSLWGLTGLAAVINTVWFIAGKKYLIPKYEERGQVMTTVMGLIQLGCGVAAVVEFCKADSGYGDAYRVAAIVSPIPSCVKVLLMLNSIDVMAVVGPLDVIGDMGGALCTLIEDTN